MIRFFDDESFESIEICWSKSSHFLLHIVYVGNYFKERLRVEEEDILIFQVLIGCAR